MKFVAYWISISRWMNVLEFQQNHRFMFNKCQEHRFHAQIINSMEICCWLLANLTRNMYVSYALRSYSDRDRDASIHRFRLSSDQVRWASPVLIPNLTQINHKINYYQWKIAQSYCCSVQLARKSAWFMRHD